MLISNYLSSESNSEPDSSKKQNSDDSDASDEFKSCYSENEGDHKEKSVKKSDLESLDSQDEEDKQDKKEVDQKELLKGMKKSTKEKDKNPNKEKYTANLNTVRIQDDKQPSQDNGEDDDYSGDLAY